ncbi:hypothetical protein ISN45_Aa02g011000 [Arabidopsis thaliana x Arabidopsis arenosa]|uniref:Uncharacterized protein n=1 Tax=Arabidopsis thaliana x Arabidopsis arenosa TaxID=1240361 RepID=A0A8T2BJT5_9BRAS|nr:hypothetical protein ISN45_Aa02g011000 [Arabidopsis thaliana x Arabidopsis arenosa]
MHKKDLPSDVLLQKISESEANKLVDEVVKSRKQELIRGTLRSKIGSAVSLLRKVDWGLIVFGKGVAYYFDSRCIFVDGFGGSISIFFIFDFCVLFFLRSDRSWRFSFVV